ncbi:MAG: 6-bladed beta-propeller [bacterium]
MNRSARRVALLLIAGIMTGCGSQEEPAVHAFEVVMEEGVATAVTSGGPLYEEPLFTYEEVLRLQQDEERPESLLSRPSYFVMDEGGWFYVTDWGQSRIACFGPTGRYSHDIGREGEGPGEFRFPSVEAVEKGVVTVFDRRLFRASRFKTDGTFIDSVPLTRSRMTIQRFRFGPGDERMLLGDYQRGSMNEYRHNTAAAVILSADGDTLASVLSDSVRVSFQIFLPDIRVGGMAPIYFSGRPGVDYHPDHGLVMTTGRDPVIGYYGLDGRLQRRIRLDAQPESVATEEREAIMEDLRGAVEEARDDSRRRMAEARIEHAEFQDPKGFWSGVRVDDRGYLWAAGPNPFAPESSPVLKVFSPEGEYLGEAAYPARRSQHMHGHVLSVIEDEETGAQELVVFRMRPAVEGFHYPE